MSDKMSRRTVAYRPSDKERTQQRMVDAAKQLHWRGLSEAQAVREVNRRSTMFTNAKYAGMSGADVGTVIADTMRLPL